MTTATDLVTEAHGITIRRRGDRLSLVAPTPPPAELLERIRQSKAALLLVLPDEGAPPSDPAKAPDLHALALIAAHAAGMPTDTAYLESVAARALLFADPDPNHKLGD